MGCSFCEQNIQDLSHQDFLGITWNGRFEVLT